MIFIILGTYIVVALAMFVFQRHLVYFPTRTIEATPADCHLRHEEVQLTTADGVKIAGWYVHADAPRGTVLFFHGNGGNVSGRLGTLMLLQRLGVDVLMIDYRGYGLSEGRPSEQGTYRDAEAAWDYLTQQRGVPAERIVIHGRSLGGAVSAHLAADRPCAGLIVESSFTSLPDMAARIYWYFPVRLLCRYRYPTQDNVRKARCPVMVIHSREDDLIPFAHGRRIFEAAAEPKRFVEIHGGHNDIHDMNQPAYEAGLRGFLAEALPR